MTDENTVSGSEARALVARWAEEVARENDVDYMFGRKQWAKELGIPVGELDKLRKAKRRELYEADLNRRGGDADASPEHSDDDVARRFVDEHHDRLRFDRTRDCWMVDDGPRWRAAKKSEIHGLIRETVRRIAARCPDMTMRRMLAGARVIEACERLARSDVRLAATAEQWDADPMLLNTPDGTIDLRTGLLRPHRAEDYLTKMTAATPDLDMAMPVFEKFLRRITGDDVALQEYLQRLFGYSLTGLTSEHVVAFCYGAGGNGKTTLLETVASIMADYHVTAALDMFVASKNDRHPTDIADLRGARLASSTETSEGRRWDEAKLKALTGGDRIKARFMGKDFFEFAPEFTLIIAGNHKPALGTVDAAIRRRMHLIPFMVEIAEGERDPHLKEKLQAEWPAIIDWMIGGCLDWQDEGLNPPPVVLSATAEYLEAEDTMAAWLEDKCELDPNAWSSSGELFDNYERYCRGRNEFVGTQKAFGEKLGRRAGIRMHRTPAARGYLGVKVKKSSLAGLAKLPAHEKSAAPKASHASSSRHRKNAAKS